MAGKALVLSCDAHLRPSQESFIHVLEESLESVSIIALRDPYDAAFFPRAAAIGAVYGDSEASIRAAARLASGRIEARGRCPVRVLGIEV
jgi:beta-N-acetylhexosaminidase